MSLPPHFFIVIYLYQFDSNDIYFILWFVIQYYCYLFSCFSGVSQWEVLLFWHALVLYEYFVTFHRYSLLQDQLVFSLPQLEINHFFLRIHGSSHWPMVFRNQDLGTRHILCYWGVNSSKPSMWTELENIGTYRLTSIFSSVSLTPTQYHEAHSSVPLFLIYNFIFWQKETWFSLLQYIYLFNPSTHTKTF